MSSQTLLISHFRYKADADRELLTALAACDASDRLRSALRVLDHAHIVDRIFAAHLRRTSHAYAASWAEAAPALPELTRSIRETDRWYLDYVTTVGSRDLEEVLDFVFTDGSRGLMSREEMLAHVVTHGGYHRGEIGRLLPEIEGTAMRDVFAGYLHRAEPERRR